MLLRKPRSSRVIFTLLACLSLVACGDSGGDGPRPTVTTQNGQVVGSTRHGANEYRGIPYGSASRLALATAAPAWSSPLDAADFGHACAQQRRFDLTEESWFEDCLTLNVSTPRAVRSGQALPVIVWIHGGAFVGGSSNLYRLDKLAREGEVVVVSVNYRLGAFGFMAHPAISESWNGNLGLEDQRLALAWVKANIAQFGGDPKNITVAGESAGGGSVCMHLLSGQKTAGLFDKAIVQSAGCMGPLPTLAQSIHPDGGDAGALWFKVSQHLGCDQYGSGTAAELNCIRTKPVEDVLEAQGLSASGVVSFSPSIASGTVPLAGHSSGEVAAALNRVPILYGGTENELRLYVAYSNLFEPFWPVTEITESELRSNWIPGYYGVGGTSALADAIVGRYFTPLGRNMTGGELGSMVSDYSPIVPINNCIYRTTVETFSQLTTVYQWEFADPDAPVLGIGIPPGRDPHMELGAVHSSELNYLFPNLSNTAAIDAPDLSPTSERLADILVATWGNFARAGSPQTGDIPTWGAFSRISGADKVMRFESPASIGMYDADARHQCSAFWGQQFPALGQ